MANANSGLVFSIFKVTGLTKLRVPKKKLPLCPTCKYQQQIIPLIKHYQFQLHKVDQGATEKTRRPTKMAAQVDRPSNEGQKQSEIGIKKAMAPSKSLWSRPTLLNFQLQHYKLIPTNTTQSYAGTIFNCGVDRGG